MTCSAFEHPASEHSASALTPAIHSTRHWQQHSACAAAAPSCTCPDSARDLTRRSDGAGGFLREPKGRHSRGVLKHLSAHERLHEKEDAAGRLVGGDEVDHEGAVGGQQGPTLVTKRAGGAGGDGGCFVDHLEGVVAPGGGVPDEKH